MKGWHCNLTRITVILLVGFLLTAWGDDHPPLESGLLYRVHLKSKQPCEYLKVILEPSPTEFRPRKVRLVKALLLAPNKITVLQRLPEKGAFEFDGSTAEQGDFNFDGWLDFRTCLWGESGSGGHFYIHYLFDPKTKRYVQSKELDALSSPKPDYDEKVIYSYARNGGMSSLRQKYQWSDGKLILLSEVLRNSDEKGFFTEYSVYKNGKKIRSEKVYLTNPEISN